MQRTQLDIDRVDAWVTSNKLCLNVYKCKFMLESRKKRGISPPILLLNGSPLEQVFSYKYFGVYLVSDMRWRTHNIYRICMKANWATIQIVLHTTMLTQPVYLSCIGP